MSMKEGVTFLKTDLLGKFDARSDDKFFLQYS